MQIRPGGACDNEPSFARLSQIDIIAHDQSTAQVRHGHLASDFKTFVGRIAGS